MITTSKGYIMRVDKPSRTAEMNAAFRAAESAKKPHTRLISDPYAFRLLPVGLRALVRLSVSPVLGSALTWAVDARWPGARTSIIARTRLIDDWISAAVDAGLTQVVLLGAGFDSRAWRLPALAGALVFEVDHPSTSAAKRDRLASLGADLTKIRFVPVDFDRQSVRDRLVEAGFKPSERTVVVWDGVTNYLQIETVDAIMTWAGCLAKGGQLIFTYVHAGVLDGTVSFEGTTSVLRTVRNSGEPWTFGMRPDLVPEYLQQHRLRLLADLDADEYRLKIMGPSAGRIRGYAFYHAARAKILGCSVR
jgi:methyltransferase (TIGR00027 family)